MKQTTAIPIQSIHIGAWPLVGYPIATGGRCLSPTITRTLHLPAADSDGLSGRDVITEGVSGNYHCQHVMIGTRHRSSGSSGSSWRQERPWGSYRRDGISSHHLLPIKSHEVMRGIFWPNFHFPEVLISPLGISKGKEENMWSTWFEGLEYFLE